MTARKLGDEFARHLHVSILKKLGFRKSRHWFWRERTGYVELFEIQGSSWNSGEGPWRFYVNVYVRFADIGPLSGVVSANPYHANGRIERIVSSAPAKFEVSSINLAQVARDLGGIIVLASEALPNLLPAAREYATRGLLSPLPVPAGWVKS